MPSSSNKFYWTNQIHVSFESDASRQFLIHGNVNDRLPSNGSLVDLENYIRDVLLEDFHVVFAYDLGNGLSIARGREHIAEWVSSGFGNLPQKPLEAARFISKYLRYLANLNVIKNKSALRVAVLIRSISQLLPIDGDGFEHGALSAIVREWGSSDPFLQLSFASLLIAENVSDVEPLVALAPHVSMIEIPLPSATELHSALRILQNKYPETISRDLDLAALAASVVGVSIRTLEQLAKVRAFEHRILQYSDFVAVKKRLIEHDAPGLVEFIQSTRTLGDYHGQDFLKRWLRQDIGLWKRNDLKALPMGYLLCGPVGTGKTFLVECLAGEVGIPVVKLKNFREKWIGSSEGNLEKIFRLVHALGRCIVFVDEADQALGRRDSGSGDSGLSGRIYSMLAQEMANTENRGKIVWVLATSRPDLIEVDLKRPGRIDLKIPILPASSQEESAALIATLMCRYDMEISYDQLAGMDGLPQFLTPGAAESLVVQAYRMVRTENIGADIALRHCLANYQNPVPRDVLEFQMRLAVREATDLSFVPRTMHYLTDEPGTEQQTSLTRI